MFTINQITMTSLFGGPYVGVYMIYKNFSSLEMMPESKRALSIGLILSTIAFIIAIYLPENAPGVVYAGLLVGIVRGVANKYQGEILNEKVQSGVTVASNWKCLRLGTLSLVATFVIVIAILCVFAILNLLPNYWYENT